MITRYFVPTLLQRLADKQPLIQLILGPRQVGKTTAAKQIMEKYKGKSIYTSAEQTIRVDNLWITEQWQEAQQAGAGTLLIIDEIQKIENWSEKIKALWDAQSDKTPIKLMLLGSSSLRIQTGLTESLVGRYELTQAYHWSFPESLEAFSYSLDDYLVYGGYPGADRFKDDFERWFQYMKASIVDPMIGQDILSHHTITKPALFRQAFSLLCAYPCREISLTSLLGQLQDKGNTDLIKHYLELFEGVFIFKSLSKYSTRFISSKNSIPKIISMCPAFYTLVKGPQAVQDPAQKGFLFESIVGADLVRAFGDQVFYWREKNAEVDFVVQHFDKLYAIEVKSGDTKNTTGMKEFCAKFTSATPIWIRLENYLEFCTDPKGFLTLANTQCPSP